MKLYEEQKTQIKSEKDTKIEENINVKKRKFDRFQAKTNSGNSEPSQVEKVGEMPKQVRRVSRTNEISPKKGKTIILKPIEEEEDQKHANS